MSEPEAWALKNPREWAVAVGLMTVPLATLFCLSLLIDHHQMNHQGRGR